MVPGRITQRTRQPCRIGAVLLLLGVLAACGGPSRGQPPAPTSSRAATAPTGVVTPSPEVATAADAAPGLQLTPGRETKALWAALREGRGVVVLLRHARTVPGTGDPPGFRLDGCVTQRNLSEDGRKQARQIGAAFRAEGVPVREVLSSQYCRCLDTAALLDLGPVTPAPMLNSFFGDRSTAATQTEEVREAILAHRERNGVVVMVTHMVNIVEVSGVSPQQGEALVVLGTAQGSVEVLGRLLVDARTQP